MKMAYTSSHNTTYSFTHQPTTAHIVGGEQTITSKQQNAHDIRPTSANNEENIDHVTGTNQHTTGNTYTVQQTTHFTLGYIYISTETALSSDITHDYVANYLFILYIIIPLISLLIIIICVILYWKKKHPPEIPDLEMQEMTHL
jgi:hypothetical protein